MVVKQELERLGLHPDKIFLGEVTIKEDELTAKQQGQLDAALINLGFERIDDRKARLIEAIKSKIIEMLHYTDRIGRKFNWSN